MRIVALVASRTVVSVLVLLAVGRAPALTHPIAIAFLVVEAIWSGIEGALAKADFGQTRKQRLQAMRTPISDTACAFLCSGKWFGMINLAYQVAVLAEFAQRAAGVPPAITASALSGLGLYAIGAALRGWAMAAMGERFRSWAVVRDARGLQSTGPYGFVRHPSYLGLLAIALSLPLIFGQPWLWLLAILPIAVIVRRIGPEEELLREVYGDEYAMYASKTRVRLIPMLW